MKKIYILAVVAFGFAFSANSQVLEDDFEDYLAGDIDAQSAQWRTWSDAAGNAEDADVTDVQGNPDNSLSITTGNDMLLLFPDLTDGVFSWSLQVYLEPDSTGFVGPMGVGADGATFGTAVYWNDNRAGGAEGDAGVYTDGGFDSSFVMPEEAWVDMTWVWDLGANSLKIAINGTVVFDGSADLDNLLGAVDIWDDGSADFYIDNLLVVEGDLLGAEDFTADVFSVYPNPVVDVLNINSQADVDSVVVYDILGKVVAQSSTKSVDMSSLSSGAYLVNVTIGDTSKTIKVIK